MVIFVGVCEDNTICDCCGKDNLKKTVALGFEGEIRHYGTTCAGRALGAKTKTAEDVKAAVHKIQERNDIEQKVRDLMLQGKNVVYGRFYVNRRSHKSILTIQSPDDLMIQQIFPTSCN